MNSSVDFSAGLACVLVALVTEMATSRIPNWLTAAGMVVGLGLGLFHGDLPAHGLGLLVLGVIAMALFIATWISGGAAKLLMAVGSLAGLGPGLTAAAAVVIFYLIAWGWWTRFASAPEDEPPDLRPRRQSVPSSPLVLVGLLAWWVVKFLWQSA